MAISLEILRTLTLDKPSQSGRQAFIAAASGLVQKEQSFFVIADDELSKLYARIEADVPELNIEGAVIRGPELLLFQRGNGSLRQNAVVCIDLATFESSAPMVSAKASKSTKNIELGECRGVPLSFTDAAMGPGGSIYFIAVAEATESTYLDGEFVGSQLGCLGVGEEVIWTKELVCPTKPEGLAIDPKNKRFYIVTDADDETRAAVLCHGQMPGD